MSDDWSARILQGDCLEVMATLADESIDAVVTDPPYGIEFMGKEWDKFIPHDRVEVSKRWASVERIDPSTANWGDGDSAKFGRLPSYGGRRTSYQCQTCGKRDAFRNPHKCGDKADWRQVPSYAGASPDVLAFEEFSKAWATEAYRVLKPGGHLLAFGAPRMYHRLASGVEDAGFEIRDSLHWIYGSGFPKSLDVSKAIDKKLGGERRRVGEREVPPETGQAHHMTRDKARREGQSDNTPKMVPVTVAATDEAAEWEGWGTALKPAHEPIVLARKPLSGTVAETVLAHGTGALNVGDTEVGADAGWSYPNGPKGNTGRGSAFEGRALGRREEPIGAEGGRWPANVLLAHLPGCEGVGAKGTDVLCAPGCPVAELNEMSGESSSPPMPLPRTPGDSLGHAHGDRNASTIRGHDDTGGAARFFYIAKPKTRERVGGTIRNLHPTVKPIDLMRYLVRLVTPPGGIVLDPFLGSGSTGCAAMLEGARLIGIERDPDSYETALARIGDYAFAADRPRPSRA